MPDDPMANFFQQPTHKDSTTTPPSGDDSIFMNFDPRSTSPPIPPRLPTPTSSRPLCIPESLVSVIQCAVMERLALNTSDLVESMVRGVVDACIPHLDELINAKLASLSTQPTPKSSRNAQGSSGGDGWEGDDEMDNGQPSASPPKGRKKPEPRGHMNHLHSAFRKYLTDKRVMTTASSKDQIPAQAPSAQVQAFNRDRSSPPVIENVAIDWNSPLNSSPWNKETVRMLAIDFQAKLKTGTSYPTVPYDDKLMNLDFLCRICLQKLSRTHQTFRQQAVIDSQPAEQQAAGISKQCIIQATQQKNDRSMARKRNIFIRRRRIAQQNRFRKPETWEEVSKVIDRLGVEGMSGDETDSPPGVYPKAVRRIETPWINSRISQLLQAVDSYESSLREENMLSPLGNAPFLRHYESRTKNMRAKAIHSLPKNWYDELWFRGLSSGERDFLFVVADVELPALEPYRHIWVLQPLPAL
ncbi:hypothetical protein JVT61DRAFT_7690 [Boletus reticuloceps]|uniref:Uncharacterized protein n=1 Tax=Boletus reticuloceps TaxID=495285 RepID=A0A8I2YJ40_9AGAM|nr:hypothetical protein JVT61DRAFT_7690 [Boletus reticuloceps]